MTNLLVIRFCATVACFGAIAAVACADAHWALAEAVPVLTQHNDNLRTGWNPDETVLTPSNVAPNTFGKLFTWQLDADVNGQPLYVPGVTIEGKVRNVVVASTSNNSNGSPCSLWAFDADSYNAGKPLWRRKFTASAQWTTCTPVIDQGSNIVYVLTKSNNDDGATRLHAISLLTGSDLPGSPVLVSASLPGTGDGSVNGVVSFTTSHADERPGLLLDNGCVYVAFAHNSDSFPYHGWVIGYEYNGSGFARTAIFCTTPNGGEGGVWMAGQGLVADSSGTIYGATGNGTFDVETGGLDYGMCYFALNPTDLSVSDWMAPHDESSLSNEDADLAGGGLAGIPNSNRLFAGGTKFGSVFVLDTSDLGGFTPGGPDNVIDRLDNVTSGDVGENPASWGKDAYSYVYLWAQGDALEQFRYDVSLGRLHPAAVYESNSVSYAGAQLSVSSNGATAGIVWSQGYDGVLRAFRAADVAQPELWDSNINSSRDFLGGIGHWQWVTVDNGKVYAPNGSSQIVVYGLLK
jgi:hypothetical protein